MRDDVRTHSLLVRKRIYDAVYSVGGSCGRLTKYFVPPLAVRSLLQDGGQSGNVS